MHRTLFRLSAFVLVAGLAVGCGPNYEIVSTRTPIEVGDTTVEVVLHDSEAPGLTYLNLHDDEDTSVQAALEVIGQYGGRVLELQHSGERNITFRIGDSTYVFDPNRMFTDRGAAASLDTLGAFSEAAHLAVRTFADNVLNQLDPASLRFVVTLHNNSEDRYSALSYGDGGDYAADARFVYLTENGDPDDFFFVTDMDLYNALRQERQNVVLQDNAMVTDDGSLSVWSAQQQLPYVNVEAQHHHLEEQVRMIELLHRLLHRAAPA